MRPGLFSLGQGAETTKTSEVTFNAALGACGQCAQWQVALQLMEDRVTDWLKCTKPCIDSGPLPRARLVRTWGRRPFHATLSHTTLPWQPLPRPGSLPPLEFLVSVRLRDQIAVRPDDGSTRCGFSAASLPEAPASAGLESRVACSTSPTITSLCIGMIAAAVLREPVAGSCDWKPALCRLHPQVQMSSPTLLSLELVLRNPPGESLQRYSRTVGEPRQMIRMGTAVEVLISSCWECSKSGEINSAASFEEAAQVQRTARADVELRWNWISLHIGACLMPVLGAGQWRAKSLRRCTRWEQSQQHVTA